MLMSSYITTILINYYLIKSFNNPSDIAVLGRSVCIVIALL